MPSAELLLSTLWVSDTLSFFISGKLCPEKRERLFMATSGLGLVLK
jgi:hypothetical protein